MRPDASTAEAVQQAIAHGAITEAYQADPQQVIQEWRLLDSRVVDVAMASNPTFVLLSSLKPFFFKSLNNELRCSDHAGA